MNAVNVNGNTPYLLGRGTPPQVTLLTIQLARATSKSRGTQFEHRTFKVKMQYPVESAGFLENTNVNRSHKFYTSCWGQFDHPG